MDETALTREIDRLFPEGQDPQTPYPNHAFDELSRLLRQVYPETERIYENPRTYLVLRLIKCLGEELEHLLDISRSGFSDYCFPVTEGLIPDGLPQEFSQDFQDKQLLVLTRRNEYDSGRHVYVESGISLPFQQGIIIGEGRLKGDLQTIVHRMHSQSGDLFARKRMPRGRRLQEQRKGLMKEFIDELTVLQTLKSNHRHTVRLVLSYTDYDSVGFIMSPAAETNLEDFMNNIVDSERPQLRPFMGCLSGALKFLHDNKVRHRDIKPSNILIHRGTVIFADFGISYAFSKTNGTTTRKGDIILTEKYSAPEHWSAQGRHNTSTDVFGLGAVFLEMLAVANMLPATQIADWLCLKGTLHSYLCKNVETLPYVIEELSSVGKESDSRVLDLIQRMCSLHMTQRPLAEEVFISLGNYRDHNNAHLFIGPCCVQSAADAVSIQISTGQYRAAVPTALNPPMSGFSANNASFLVRQNYDPSGDSLTYDTGVQIGSNYGYIGDIGRQR